MIRSPAGFDGGDRIKRYLDYYQPSYGVMMLSAGQAFSPASLFASGEQGVWYDPSDFSTMFQDSAGTTPVTAVEQPVGLLLDKSQGLVLGPELVSPINFTSGWTTSGGAVTFDSASTYTAAGIANVFRAFVTTGKWYKMTFNISFTSAGVNVYNATSAVNLVNSATIVSGTSYTFYFLAAATQINFRPTSAGTVTVNSVTLQELPGNHATQATSASRPVLSARVNQLLATATLSTQNVTTLAATYTLSFSGAGIVTATGTNIGVYSAGSNSLVCTAGTLTLTVVGSVTLADLRPTNQVALLPAYQAVVTSTNYDTTGFPYYLKFDGTDDSMVTATITPGTDKAQVFGGVRKLSDAARGIVAELGAGVPTGAWAISTARTANDIDFGLSGTSSTNRSATTFVAPITVVLSCAYDISEASAATEIIPRINAATPTLSAGTNAGTGNFSANPLYIGRRGGTTLPFNGNIYSLIVRFGSNLDATTISNTETWVNGKTMAY